MLVLVALNMQRHEVIGTNYFNCCFTLLSLDSWNIEALLNKTKHPPNKSIGLVHFRVVNCRWLGPFNLLCVSVWNSMESLFTRKNLTLLLDSIRHFFRFLRHRENPLKYTPYKPNIFHLQWMLRGASTRLHLRCIPCFYSIYLYSKCNMTAGNLWCAL